MKIAVIGTGYVGLVTGSCFAYVGNEVFCVDIDKKKINNLNKKIIPIFEDKLEDIVSDSMDNGRLSFTTNLKLAINNSDIIFLAVSTPMDEDGSSKLDYILRAARDVGKYINDYKIIVIKSTVPVGVTFLIQEEIAKEINSRGVEIPFDIACNPEFLKEGKAVEDFMSPDRIIVGIENNQLKDTFKKLYQPFSMNHEKTIFMDINSSELTKYAANTMLAIKISFINEISQLCEKNGADINNVRKGIGSDSRIGYSFIYPSIGFGGSCFPKDVNSLKMQFKQAGLTSLMSTATLGVNQFQWKNFTLRILNKLNNSNLKNKNIGVWGITFKPGTDDIRESQAIKIIDMLLDNNFIINIYDPKGMENSKKYYKNKENINFFNNKYDALYDCDAMLLLTEWKEFRSPDFNRIKTCMKRAIIFDGRNIFNSYDLKSRGFEYFQIGVKDEV